MWKEKKTNVNKERADKLNEKCGVDKLDPKQSFLFPQSTTL